MLYKGKGQYTDDQRSVLVPQKCLGQGNWTDRRHLRKPVEFKMLLRPILLHVAKYSEYISDRDTEPSEFVSKCAFNLLGGGGGAQTEQLPSRQVDDLSSHLWGGLILPLQCKLFPVQFHNTRWWLVGLSWGPCP